jgi:Ca2+-binding RTX toxin-like protein
MWGEAGNDLVSGDAGNDRMSGGDDDDVMSGGPDDDVVCGDGESVVGDQLSDGDPDPGVDLLWANVIADMGVYCYNVSTRYDCAEVPLSGAGTCSDACLGARPIECP